MGRRLPDQYALIPFLDYAPDTVVVSVFSAEFLSANNNRVGIIFSNNGANDVYLYPGSANPPNAGFKLPPDSAPFEVSFTEHGVLPMRSWFVVCNTGTSALFYTEILYTPRNQRIISGVETQVDNNGRF